MIRPLNTQTPDLIRVTMRHPRIRPPIIGTVSRTTIRVEMDIGIMIRTSMTTIMMPNMTTITMEDTTPSSTNQREITINTRSKSHSSLMRNTHKDHTIPTTTIIHILIPTSITQILSPLTINKATPNRSLRARQIHRSSTALSTHRTHKAHS